MLTIYENPLYTSTNQFDERRVNHMFSNDQRILKKASLMKRCIFLVGESACERKSFSRGLGMTSLKNVRVSDQTVPIEIMRVNV